ncbi:hypothetical protein ACSQ67_000878 [Phaseolus vulgaris]
MMDEAQYWVEKSCSTSRRSCEQDSEDDQIIALMLSKEYAKLDGKRLSNFAPIPHVPQINSYIRNVIIDHQRLLHRLNKHGVYEVEVSADGNCQLKDHRSLYECYVPMKYKQYYKKMAKFGEWGDHVTLQAAADKTTSPPQLPTSILIASIPENPVLKIIPASPGLTLMHSSIKMSSYKPEKRKNVFELCTRFFQVQTISRLVSASHKSVLLTTPPASAPAIFNQPESIQQP